MSNHKNKRRKKMKSAANNPDSDAINIWDSAKEDGIRKYKAGRASYKTCFWIGRASCRERV